MAKILISGGTGLIGTRLCEMLAKRGEEVCILSRTRSGEEDFTTYLWNIEKGDIEEAALKNTDVIIHLAGASIGHGRWTNERKKVIVDSRVNSANLLYEAVKKLKIRPKAFISASGTGYYGAVTIDHVFKENDPPANDFLGLTCQKWEAVADQFTTLGMRVVKFRTAVVLDKNEGALPRLAQIINMGIGSPAGSGNQYMPWIHLEDLCRLYIKAIDEEVYKGAINGVAPEHQTNKEFMKILSKVLKKPFWMPNVPAFVLKLILGEQSDLVLKGSRVSSEKAQNLGFKFEFPKLESALIQVYKN